MKGNSMLWYYIIKYDVIIYDKYGMGNDKQHWNLIFVKNILHDLLVSSNMVIGETMSRITI